MAKRSQSLKSWGFFFGILVVVVVICMVCFGCGSGDFYFNKVISAVLRLISVIIFKVRMLSYNGEHLVSWFFSMFLFRL